ncbi:MAG: LPS assembly lipoprotein LptE [Syntrophales bacterium]|nr:LPS assembly lipoprotein LptE [Syntrophales bacterium]
MKSLNLLYLKRVVILCCFLLVAACGYSFIPDGDAIDKSIQKIFVDVFVNKTSEANIENSFRTAFIDRVNQGRRFKLAGSPEEADAILKGSIEGLSAAPLSYQATNLAAEDRITVVLSLTLEAQNPKKVIWMSSSFSGTQDYLMGNNLSVAQANRKNALITLSNNTAERAYRLMMSGF